MSADTATDLELGLLARRGDVQALAVLLERCRPSLYATALGLLGSRADALDAVQDTCVVALVRLGGLRDAGAARAWLHAIVRNVCLMRIRRRRDLPSGVIEPLDVAPDPAEVLEEHVARDWVWRALDDLPANERLTVMLRYFTRCTTYEAIARLTAAPVGTVRSRLNRARSRLAGSLLEIASAPIDDHAGIETSRRTQWEDFYRSLQEHPSPHTYKELFVPDVDVRDRSGHWVGLDDWSAHEREAITLGVRATIVDLLASRDLTVVEIDFTNPPTSSEHCPPQATFVHTLDRGRSRRLRIHYPLEGTLQSA